MQIRCGDLYNDQAIQTFTACAVSDKKCVPQKIDRDAFPEPKPDKLDKNFDLGKFEVCFRSFSLRLTVPFSSPVFIATPYGKALACVDAIKRFAVI